VFCQQAGPGVENSFGAVAQAWSECVPLIVIPAGSSRREAWVKPGFNATLNYQHITKSAEMITTPISSCRPCAGLHPVAQRSSGSLSH